MVFSIKHLNREMNNMTQPFLKKNLAFKTIKYLLLIETYIQLGFKERNNSYSKSPHLLKSAHNTSLNMAFNR